MSEIKKDPVEVQLTALKQEVDAIQISILSDSKPWYRQISILIALFAFIFSLGTTAVSFYQSAQQEVQSARLELRSLIKELTEHPKLSAEILQTYKHDLPTIQLLSSTLNTRNIVLAKQARATIDVIEGSLLGSKSVLAEEYFAIVTALRNSGQESRISEYLEEALDRADDPMTATSALRALAGVAGSMKDVAKMRELMEQARMIPEDERYKSTTMLAKHLVYAETELQWWEMEFSLKNCDVLKAHSDLAQLSIEKLFDSPLKNQYRNRLNSQLMRAQRC